MWIPAATITVAKAKGDGGILRRDAALIGRKLPQWEIAYLRKSGKYPEMLIIAEAAAAVRKMTFVDVYLSAGFGGHVSTLLFFGGLVLAWRIHRKGLGLRHRLVLVLVAFLPLLVGIYCAVSDFIIQARAINRTSELGDFASPSSRLGGVPVGAFECLGLLGESARSCS